MPNRGRCHSLILALLLCLALGAAAGAADAQTWYSSYGFEGFFPGTVADQDSWGVIGPLGNATIQADPLGAHGNILVLTTAADVIYAYRLDNWAPVTSGLPVVTLHARIRPDDAAGWRWVYFYTDHHSYENPPGRGIALNFGPDYNGSPRAYAYEVPGGESNPLGLGAYVPGQWGDLAITLDYNTQQYEVTWNGTSTHFRPLVANAGASQFQGWSFGVQDAPTIMHVDDVLIAAAPTTLLRDVRPDHWAWYQINACLDAAVVSAYPDGTYQPSYAVTRDQMAVYISRALAGGDANVPPGPSTPSFCDVPADDWAFKYVEFAAAQNVVTGYSNSDYGPALVVDRGQMAVFIARALVAPAGDAGVPEPPATQQSFPDVTRTNSWSWCFKHVEHIAHTAPAVTQGYADALYHPEYVCTRDQMAVYVQRAFNLPM
jgi:hypothetical protein